MIKKKLVFELYVLILSIVGIFVKFYFCKNCIRCYLKMKNCGNSLFLNLLNINFIFILVNKDIMLLYVFFLWI